MIDIDILWRYILPCEWYHIYSNKTCTYFPRIKQYTSEFLLYSRYFGSIIMLTDNVTYIEL